MIISVNLKVGGGVGLEQGWLLKGGSKLGVVVFSGFGMGWEFGELEDIRRLAIWLALWAIGIWMYDFYKESLEVGWVKGIRLGRLWV